MNYIADVFYYVIIRPLEILFEAVFSIADRHLPNPGFTLIFLSITVSLLCLPLYMRADAIQRRSDLRMKAMQPGIDKIKKTFKGDERVMVLQTYYRENGYRPYMALGSSVSLLLQIPFFISMYRLVSSLTELKGTAFGPISDLSLPDGLITAGGISVNILPILMTLINIISGIIYSKGQPLKNKIQLYLVAAVFLVLLYTSPSGLVLYWTCNNIFSLGKNIAGDLMHRDGKVKEEKAEPVVPAATDALFWICGTFLTLFTGLYIPSTVIKASPVEFIDFFTLQDPAHYLFVSTLIAAGFMLFWAGTFYLVLGKRCRRGFAYVMTIVSLFAAVNYFAFDKGLGDMDSALIFDILPEYTASYAVINLAVLAVTGVIVYVLLRKKEILFNCLLGAAAAAVLIAGAMNVLYISAYSSMHLKGRDTDAISWQLSRNGRNVVVIMADRALGAALPYILDDEPELLDKLDGFTYYPNTVSNGAYTNFAAPALFGGYDYTVSELNARADETLADKHNEALHVMPYVFSHNGFDTYFINPTYAGYGWIPDLTVFDDMPEITVGNSLSKFNSYREQMDGSLSYVRERNFFCYGIFKTAPVFLRGILYHSGDYNGSVRDPHEISSPQNISADGLSATGMDMNFTDAYSFISSLGEVTQIGDGTNGSFVMFSTDVAHEDALLQLPDLTVSQHTDNTLYSSYYEDRVLDGRTLHMRSTVSVENYMANTAMLLRLGEWFDMLREQGVWDNTRIIIVSDHGRDLNMFDDMMTGDLDIMQVNPLLLVKDFGSEGFSVSYEFMTNADTPALAMQGLIDDPVNPYTGNPIDMSGKTDGMLVFMSDIHDVEQNGTNTFLPGSWYRVRQDISDPDNWEFLGDY